MSESDSFPFPFPSKRKSHITYLSRIKRSRSDEERDTQVVMLSSDEEVDIVDMYESNDEEDDEDDDPLLLSPMIPLTPKVSDKHVSSPIILSSLPASHTPTPLSLIRQPGLSLATFLFNLLHQSIK